LNTSNPQPVQLRYWNLLLEAASEKIADGEWSGTFAVFKIDREKLVYWMPSLFRAFATEREAERAAHIAGLEFIEHLD
jgi:hypothetical protein